MAKKTTARAKIAALKEPVITLSAGPVAAYPRILQAMSRPVQYDYDPWFQQYYEAIAKKAAKAMRTRQPALILQVEPAPGIEAAAASLISPNDVVLNLASGVYGKGFGYWSARYHKEMVEIEVPYNEAIDPGQVADAFRKRPDIKVVSLVHHDTPSPPSAAWTSTPMIASRTSSSPVPASAWAARRASQ